ncbi:MAG: hypothetical protein ACRENJ_11795, partial [Candidatus Eiseniibacteriota bacterium]
MSVRVTGTGSLLIVLGVALSSATSAPARADAPGSKPPDFSRRVATRALGAESPPPRAALDRPGVIGLETIASTATIENVPVCTALQEQYAPVMVQAGGGEIVVWDDYRGGERDIYAQKLGAAGVTQWVLDGVPVCKATGSQRDPRAISDGAGGAIVVWQDARAGATDIYAQRIDADGVALWATGGVLVCGAGGDQKAPVVVGDGQGGAVVAWVDERSAGSDVYAQRIGAGGVMQWGGGGVAVCTAWGVQQELAVVGDGQRGAIVVWQDRRSGTGDIYARRVDESGVAQWGADGVALCGA